MELRPEDEGLSGGGCVVGLGQGRGITEVGGFGGSVNGRRYGVGRGGEVSRWSCQGKCVCVSE